MIFTAFRSHFTEAFNISQQNCFHLIIHKILPAMTNGAPQLESRTLRWNGAKNKSQINILS